MTDTHRTTDERITDARLAELIRRSGEACDCKPSSGCGRRAMESAMRELQQRRLAPEPDGAMPIVPHDFGDRVGYAIRPTAEAADAFWKYWRENGETHRHGYYEATWGAINKALQAACPTPTKEGKQS